METLDREAARLIEAARSRDFRVLLTADHGNCEEMVDAQTGEPHTRHTGYPVPLLLIGERLSLCASGGGLADVAPTVLALMGIAQPAAMSGHSLIGGGEVIRRAP